MATPSFATPADYTRFAEDDSDLSDEVLTKRLRSATIEVQKLIRLAHYDVDDNGQPTGTALLEALAEATCAIVEYWQETGDHSGADAHAGAVKIGSVSLGTTSSRETATDGQSDRLGGKALAILGNAGLYLAVGY
ncbi:hypothetical protein B7R22_17185 [Subtercola boreus]|uniref:Uncharacterized protein n=1 Tax=Subtercola boreus TaxID=120213 RepID=A0A3E0VQA0_9MICO|nr:hypothetical protein [Subtercola boreus]RFA12162.1 hypothetical protein B7R22_17185 [Subtercola boreus]